MTVLNFTEITFRETVFTLRKAIKCTRHGSDWWYDTSYFQLADALTLFYPTSKDTRCTVRYAKIRTRTRAAKYPIAWRVEIMRTCAYTVHVCVNARGVFFAAKVKVVLELAARSVGRSRVPSVGRLQRRGEEKEDSRNGGVYVGGALVCEGKYEVVLNVGRERGINRVRARGKLTVLRVEWDQGCILSEG